ncbi:hypothetical protein M0813_20837 [Anaeramoeba flamelloides]|uniref:Bromo domain-containing protein n=1 Tax=Anaeramoeba flamelloides TaxID=1746091 RepID=A0ABQ8YJH1_9EUKA|nr:hypothetical protein M0813_20837 [Anaeramoeba flamelloides]
MSTNQNDEETTKKKEINQVDNQFLREQFFERKYHFFNSQSTKIGYLSYLQQKPYDKKRKDLFFIALKQIKDKLENGFENEYLEGIGSSLEFVRSSLQGNLGTEEQIDLFRNYGLFEFSQAYYKRSFNDKFVRPVMQFYKEAIDFLLENFKDDLFAKCSKTFCIILHVSSYDKWDSVRKTMHIDKDYEDERKVFQQIPHYQLATKPYDPDFFSKSFIKRMKFGPLSEKETEAVETRHEKSKKLLIPIKRRPLKKPQFAVLRENDKLTSLYLLRNIEYFGKKKGFQILLDEIDNIYNNVRKERKQIEKETKPEKKKNQKKRKEKKKK